MFGTFWRGSHGNAEQPMRVKALRVGARWGKVRQVEAVMARRVLARPVAAWNGEVRSGKAVSAWQSSALFVSARIGSRGESRAA